MKNTCCALLPAKTSWKMPIMKKICCVLLQAELHDVDMLCFAAGLIVKEIQLCTLVHLLCTFSNVFIKWNASGAKSRAGRVCMSGDMLAIKIFTKIRGKNEGCNMQYEKKTQKKQKK